MCCDISILPRGKTMPRTSQFRPIRPNPTSRPPCSLHSLHPTQIPTLSIIHGMPMRSIFWPVIPQNRQSYTYIPSTLNTKFIFWHPQIVYYGCNHELFILLFMAFLVKIRVCKNLKKFETCPALNFRVFLRHGTRNLKKILLKPDPTPP